MAGILFIISAPSGSGKSTLVSEVRKQLSGIEFSVSWTTRPPRGSEQDGREYNFTNPVSGQPETKKITVTDPAIPLWMMSSEGLPAFMYDKIFLLIDEYGQGDGEVKRSIAEIFLNGGTPPWYLPAGSVRLACTNAGPRYGVSKDFDFAIARRTTIHIDGDINVTMNYLDKPYYHQGKQWQTLPVVKAWAAQHPESVFEQEPKEQGPWCNPRQLCAVDRYIGSCSHGNACIGRSKRRRIIDAITSHTNDVTLRLQSLNQV